ncbi:diacylglycerol kinase, partial [Delftia acidovorans]|uniref:diacylglycerol kinase n=1 Tax=Delftia acidovorans TaxID=80866 RepID=UPI0028E61D18
ILGRHHRKKWLSFRSASTRLEAMLALVLIPLSIVVGNGLLEILFLLSGVFLVLIVEILNSAIESAIDRFGQEENELSRKAKDLGSAAVFVAIIFCTIIWCTLIFKNIWIDK